MDELNKKNAFLNNSANSRINHTVSLRKKKRDVKLFKLRVVSDIKSNANLSQIFSLTDCILKFDLNAIL